VPLIRPRNLPTHCVTMKKKAISIVLAEWYRNNTFVNVVSFCHEPIKKPVLPTCQLTNLTDRRNT
jgi:hypothetical protein